MEGKGSKGTIPKIIHYCWFGGKPIVPLMKMNLYAEPMRKSSWDLSVIIIA